jgi:glycosyltransferase involved in cell wall biosynthesis
MSTPRVSVITIFRDAERFLPAAVASVQAQTLDGWELLLVDDGSTDGGSALAQAFADADPDRIRYLSHPGHAALGTSASRNRGARAARAPLLAFLDADDVYLPQRLARHLAVLDAEPAVDAVQSDAIYWIAPRSADDAAAEHRQRQGIWPDGARLVPPEGVVALLALPALHVFTCDLTVRRACFDRIGGFDDAFPRTHEDLVFFTKLYSEGRVAVIAEFLAKVRRHDGSATRAAQHSAHRADGVYQTDARAFRAWIGRYLREHEVRDPMVLELLAGLEAGGRPPARKGWLISARARVFAALERFAPAAVHRATVRCYRSMVRYHARRRFAAIRDHARELGSEWAR